KYVERVAKKQKLKRLFVFTTRTAHWFQERGFNTVELDALPIERQQAYNYQRQSRVFLKKL
ncbi:MAG: hypothetical protein KAJ19_06450, partial [Gammaproteobacteria bacterium]|nr:hypothetical protein [Gammaproteobacteria bacterium]